MKEKLLRGRKVIRGYIDINYDDIYIFSHEKMFIHQKIGELSKLIKDFDGRKVKITIEELE